MTFKPLNVFCHISFGWVISILIVTLNLPFDKKKRKNLKSCFCS